MTLSVIIPVYQVEPYVRRCLESVMSQRQADADIECLIVDDCGEDRSMEIVRQTIADYRGTIRFKIIEHDKNRGLSVARNTGLMKATGDYVMFVDSDDYLMPESISSFAENLRQHPEADMLVGNVRNCKNDELLFPDLREPQLLKGNREIFLQMLHRQIYLYAWNKLIRRSVLSEHAVRFVEGILYEDESWSYQLFSCLDTILLLPKVTYVYEYNGQSIVNTTLVSGNVDKVIWSYLVSSNKILDNLPSPARFVCHEEVDSLLFVCNILMRASDLLCRYRVARHLSCFKATRRRLLSRSLTKGRLLLSAFFLMLYSPFSYLQRWECFRRHYYDMERLTGKVCHLTDFLHRSSKNSIPL